MRDNIEPLAREIALSCVRALAPHEPEAKIDARVDRYWPVVAALIEAGAIDDCGRELRVMSDDENEALVNREMGWV